MGEPKRQHYLDLQRAHLRWFVHLPVQLYGHPPDHCKRHSYLHRFLQRRRLVLVNRRRFLAPNLALVSLGTERTNFQHRHCGQASQCLVASDLILDQLLGIFSAYALNDVGNC